MFGTEHPEACFLRAVHAQRHGDLASAIETLRAAVAEHERSMTCRYGLATCLVHAGELTAAEPLVNELIAFGDESWESDLVQTGTTRPQDLGYAYLIRAALELARGGAQVATNWIARALDEEGVPHAVVATMPELVQLDHDERYVKMMNARRQASCEDAADGRGDG
jgi:hypothetical protein